ncbi:hypothetical protein FKP32DRAFT_1675453 [Trametes sanguinea]|nr:hypothetical protein FKP32DRAFT_1675453 [Trametes sanguinea]
MDVTIPVTKSSLLERFDLVDPPTKLQTREIGPLRGQESMQASMHEVQRTLELIRIYGEDITQAKHNLAATVTAPEFPDSEWTNVLLGQAVNLDRVFNGQYTSTTDDKVIEKIGELELRYRPTVPAKKIRNFGDWVFAWN